MTASKVVPMTRTKRKRVDTIVLDEATVARFKHPPFQRPVKQNAAVGQIAKTITETGVFPGILTVGLFNGSEWIIDGQHRLAGVELSGRKDVLADVHYIECDSMGEMAEEFWHLNTALVRFTADDVLRSLEYGNDALKTIKKGCPFIGYGNIRRGETSPILSMSVAIRMWIASERESPHTRAGAVSLLAGSLTKEEAELAVVFLTMAFESWGRSKEYARLWGALNLVLCMWLYRKLVLRQGVSTDSRFATTTRTEFGKCLMTLSTSLQYLDYLQGRMFNDEHRSPTYERIKTMFATRLRQERGEAVRLPSPSWAGSHGKGR